MPHAGLATELENSEGIKNRDEDIWQQKLCKQDHKHKDARLHTRVGAYVHTGDCSHLSLLTPQLQIGVANSVRIAVWSCGGCRCVLLQSDVQLNSGCLMSVPAKQPGLSKGLTRSRCRRLWLVSLDAAKPFRPTGLLPNCAGKTAANCWHSGDYHRLVQNPPFISGSQCLWLVTLASEIFHMWDTHAKTKTSKIFCF